MLTQPHLAVLRAALQFFDEELGPHGVDAMRTYFDEPLNEELTSIEIQQLRAFLRNCELRYGRYSPRSGELGSPALSASPDEIPASTADPACCVVTIILPPADDSPHSPSFSRYG